MSKRILINATPAGEVWATFVENGTLEELFVESSRKQVMRGNIYRAHVTSIDNKLRAAFIDYGSDRNGFISVKEIHPDAFSRSPGKERDYLVSDVLHVGQPLLVQLKKEEDGSKGAAFTTDITLASAYTVISPVSGGEFTISRKITDSKIKKELRGVMKQCDPENRYGVMLRTASEGRESHEVLADLQNQLRAWGFIQADFQTKRAPCLLYRESQLITRMVRDHFTDDVDEIILDDEEAFEDLKRYCEERLPNAVPKLRLYEERLPLFVRYKVEGQINQLTAHQIDLPSGGNISINHTEAATVFDINSSRQSGGGDQQQMFLVTNCEAAELIARQIRLRGIGGLIFIDFINMRELKHRRQIEKVFKEAIKRDRAHLEVGMISRFCVLELSRNRIQERSLSTTHTSCPTCSGSGYIPSPNVVAFKLINSLYALAERVGPGRAIKGKLPVAHAMYLLNDKRSVLVDLEERYGVTVEIEADFTQSLLAPDPFSEGGRAQRETGVSKQSTDRRDRRDRRERKDRTEMTQRSTQRALRETIDVVDPSGEERREVSSGSQPASSPQQPEGGFTPPQIIGFISKEQLDRAEAAALLSQNPTRDSFEGRPARGEAGSVDAERSQPDREMLDAGDRSGKRKRRRRRGKNRDQRPPQEMQAHSQEESAPTTENAQEESGAEQITTSISSSRPDLDERAKRRAEARARRRAHRAQRLREGQMSQESLSYPQAGDEAELGLSERREAKPQNFRRHGEQEERASQAERHRVRGSREPSREEASSEVHTHEKLHPAQVDHESPARSPDHEISGKRRQRNRRAQRDHESSVTKSRETRQGDGSRDTSTPSTEPRGLQREPRSRAEQGSLESVHSDDKRASVKRAESAGASERATPAVTPESVKRTAPETTSRGEATESAPVTAKAKPTTKKSVTKKATKETTTKEAAPKRPADGEASESTPVTAKKKAAKKTSTKKAASGEATESAQVTAKAKSATPKASKKEAPKKVVSGEAAESVPVTAKTKSATPKKASKKAAPKKAASGEAAESAPVTSKAKRATPNEAAKKTATPKKAAKKTATTKSTEEGISAARRTGASALLDQLGQE